MKFDRWCTCQSWSENFFLDLTRLVEDYVEADERNHLPCAALYERYLANGWQAKENNPDLKPMDASTFGRVISRATDCKITLVFRLKFQSRAMGNTADT